MGWADRAISKHVTQLVRATLHKCEQRRGKRARETPEPAAATCVQKAAAHPESDQTLLQTSEKLTNLDIESEKETNKYDNNTDFTPVVSPLMLLDALLTWINAR